VFVDVFAHCKPVQRHRGKNFFFLHSVFQRRLALAFWSSTLFTSFSFGTASGFNDAVTVLWRGSFGDGFGK